MKYSLIPLQENRVRRNYTGGAEIDLLQKKANPTDRDQPELWLGSLVEASNPGLPSVSAEGLVRTALPGCPLLVTVIAQNPSFYLGDSYDGTLELGFLLKMLDSAVRLHTQAHPTAAYAKKHLNSPFGKLECYYILSVRDGVTPYLRLGFQHPPSSAEWRQTILTQDKEAMDSYFEQIPVAAGEVWYVPGGVPHAIGEGILMLELMEPSDLVVRCEFEREGIIVPEEARFMGKTIDEYLALFDYTAYPIEQVSKQFRMEPTRLFQTKFLTVDALIENQKVKPFQLLRLRMPSGGVESIPLAACLPQGFPGVGVVTKGSTTVRIGEEQLVLSAGESFFLSATRPADLELKASFGFELCIAHRVANRAES